MHSLIVGFLTVFMVLDCILLIFLILLQLPKKEAGAGLAFGGAATDALFGAGSGNILTKITKWMAGGFFGLAILLAIVGKPPKPDLDIREQLVKPSATTASTPAASAPLAPSADAAKGASAVPAPTPAPIPAASPSAAAPAGK